MDKKSKLRHKLNNLLSVISLSTYKLERIANKHQDSELTEIVFKINKTIETMKDILRKDKE